MLWKWMHFLPQMTAFKYILSWLFELHGYWPISPTALKLHAVFQLAATSECHVDHSIVCCMKFTYWVHPTVSWMNVLRPKQCLHPSVSWMITVTKLHSSFCQHLLFCVIGHFKMALLWYVWGPNEGSKLSWHTYLHADCESCDVACLVAAIKGRVRAAVLSPPR